MAIGWRGSGWNAGGWGRRRPTSPANLGLDAHPHQGGEQPPARSMASGSCIEQRVVAETPRSSKIQWQQGKIFWQRTAGSRLPETTRGITSLPATLFETTVVRRRRPRSVHVRDQG